MSLLLSDEERNRFASWLELEIESSKGMIEQFKKLGQIGEPLIKRETVEMQAALIIARKLRSIESFSIEG
jgi:hypothetical protein